MACRDLSIETDAAVGAAGIPTVASWLGIDALRAAGRRLAGKGSGPTTHRLPILRGVQGVLRPVSAAVGGRGWPRQQGESYCQLPVPHGPC